MTAPIDNKHARAAAVKMLATLKALPVEHRMDALVLTAAVFVQTNGHLRVGENEKR